MRLAKVLLLVKQTKKISKQKGDVVKMAQQYFVYKPHFIPNIGGVMPTPPVKPDAPEVSELMAEYNRAVSIYNEEMKEIRDKYQKSVDFWSKNATVK